MNETFMKEKPVLPLLVSMALPNVISMLVNSLYNIVDSLFVARISEDAMTALSLVFPIQNFANAIAIGFGIGINAMIALYLGAGDHKKAETAATHGMALSLMHGILITIVSIVIMPGFLRRFTSDAGLIASGITYSTIVFLFATINMAALAFEKMFQAVGRMKVTMVALVFGCVCNILLDPILIFGLGPVPAMGIAGAALATGIGQLLSLCVYLFVYVRTELPIRLRRSCLRPDAALDGKLYAIPVSVYGSTLSYMPSKLEEIGLTVGADVPFCVRGGLQRAQGVGERLTPLEMKKPLYLVAFQPCRGLSTKEVFTALHEDGIRGEDRPDNEAAQRALAAGGVIGDLIKTNASISGAECGCQAEIGSACSMAAAAMCELMEFPIEQIEYAAEIAMEHHLGLTCDPICGLVQIPCIERNAVAAARALDANSYANLSDGHHMISYDRVVEVMKETGKDIPSLYRETSEGGLARNYTQK